MAVTHIWDTNIAIYLLDDELTPEAEQVIQQYLDEGQAGISVISELELLGFKGMTPGKTKQAKLFLNAFKLFNLEDKTKEATIELRRMYKIKLPDAIIAATAIAFDLTLLSRNEKDFQDIKGLNS